MKKVMIMLVCAFLLGACQNETTPAPAGGLDFWGKTFVVTDGDMLTAGDVITFTTDVVTLNGTDYPVTVTDMGPGGRVWAAGFSACATFYVTMDAGGIKVVNCGGQEARLNEVI